MLLEKGYGIAKVGRLHFPRDSDCLVSAPEYWKSMGRSGDGVAHIYRFFSETLYSRARDTISRFHSLIHNSNQGTKKHIEGCSRSQVAKRSARGPDLVAPYRH